MSKVVKGQYGTFLNPCEINKSLIIFFINPLHFCIIKFYWGALLLDRREGLSKNIKGLVNFI